MKKELEETLFKKYPKLFFKNGKETISNIECDDGWFNIINFACESIQKNIDFLRSQRARALRFNRSLIRALAGNKTDVEYTFKKIYKNVDITNCVVAAAINSKKFQTINKRKEQIKIVQIKEKFGTLRIYVTGVCSDEYANGVIEMAESISSVTCECCGNVGKCRNAAWIRTLCDSCYENKQ